MAVSRNIRQIRSNPHYHGNPPEETSWSICPSANFEMVLPHLRPAVVVIVTQEAAWAPAGRPCPTRTFTSVQFALVLLRTAAVDRWQSEATGLFSPVPSGRTPVGCLCL